MSNRKKNNPRLLSSVLQAIAELKDNRGSTMKKIIDHIQVGIKKGKLKPKPRNVVMQVKRAINYAVKAGVLKQKSGRYKLSITSDSSNKKSNQKVAPKKKEASRKRGPTDKPAHPKRVKRSREKPKRRHARRRHDSYSSAATEASMSSAPTSYASETTNDSTSYASSTFEERKSRRKSLKHRQRGDKEKPRRSQHKETPSEPENNEENDDQYGSHEEQQDTMMRRRSSNRMQQMQPDYDRVGQYINEESVGNECDNPDCLCNLKQEPMEGISGQYEDDMNSAEYLN